MSQPIIGIKGVRTYPNDFSQTAPGSLAIGDDIEINRADVAEPRRGFPSVSGLFASNSRMRQMCWWNGYIIGHHEDGTLAYYDGGGWTLFSGNYPIPGPGFRVPMQAANQSLYISTANGTYVLDSLTTGFVAAGVPRALDLTLTAGGAGTALRAGSQAAYRAVWGKKDANGYLKWGAPSQRVAIANSTGTTVDVSVSVRIPLNVTTSHFLQVYRTSCSADANTDPGDSIQLVYEYLPTDLDLAGNVVTFTDVAPDTLRGAALYTNPDLPNGGAGAARLPPPAARTLAWFKGSLFYGNCRQPNRMIMNLLAVGGSGMKDGSQLQIIYINNDLPALQRALKITARTTPTLSTEFQLYTGGTPAQNVDNTARAIVAKVNQLFFTSFGSMYAFYLSGPEDAPGKILFEATYFEADAGYTSVLAGSGEANYWSPSAPEWDFIAIGNMVRSGTTVTVTTDASHSLQVGQRAWLQLGAGFVEPSFVSGQKTITAVLSPTQFRYTEAGPAASSVQNFGVLFRGPWDDPAVASITYPTPLASKVRTEDAKNVVYWSEPGEPDAVPLRNSFRVGGDDKAIIAMVPLRDSLMVWKEDGLFKITGSGGVFSWEMVDSTLRLLGPELTRVLQNQAFALTDQGAVAVPEQGTARILSADIRDQFPNTTSANLSAYGWALAQETHGEFRLATVFQDVDPTVPSHQWVYNVFTDTWVRHKLLRTAGYVSPSSDVTSPDFMYMANPATRTLTRDVKGGFIAYDYIFATTITAVGAGTVTLAALPTEFSLQLGDSIIQGGNVGMVLAVVGNVVTLQPNALTWTTGAVTVFGAFESIIKWSPFAQPSPGALKQVSEVSMYFRSAAFWLARLGFATDLVPTEELNYADGPGAPGLVSTKHCIREFLPQQMRMATQLDLSLRIRNALATWQLQGIDLTTVDMTGERQQ